MEKKLVNESEMKELLKEDFQNCFVLNKDEKQVLLLRFGLTEHGKVTFEDTAKLLNKSIEEIQKIQIEALEKFHTYRRYHVFGSNPSVSELSYSEYYDVEKLKKHLNDMMYLFSPIEQEALALRYGLKDGKPRTIKEISEFLELKEKKVRNMLLECIRKFRGFIPYDSKNPKLISYEINEKLKKDLYKNFKIFNELERVLLSLRFGFNGFDALPFDILSSVFNRTPGELIEIEMGAIDKYHKFKTNK